MVSDYRDGVLPKMSGSSSLTQLRGLEIWNGKRGTESQQPHSLVSSGIRLHLSEPQL